MEENFRYIAKESLVVRLVGSSFGKVRNWLDLLNPFIKILKWTEGLIFGLISRVGWISKQLGWNNLFTSVHFPVFKLIVGHMIWHELGQEYDGEWSHGRQHGKGEGVWHGQKKTIYNGDWQYGQRSGIGKMEYANGSSYEGRALFRQSKTFWIINFVDG